ncbi:MAG: phosphoadenosine phosphosulfate reductase [Sphingomonas sp. 28-66-16]|nr:MAG: phosphoadenosine phosphosulfate reductase [Sphingomonas sp. 28-66-16]
MPSATATITEPMLDTLIGRLHDVRVQVPGRLVFTTSFGREDQAILHAIVAASLDVALVTLDTGRLFPETYDLWAETEARYGVRIRAVYPDAEALATYVGSHGINGFRDAKELRLACCHIRKVAPLATALDGAEGWITGLRSGRTEGEIVPLIARDEARGMWKAAPLADWSVEEVIEFCARHDVPVNALHAAGFPSIGCAPCTRAVLPGEPERAGRWWWESDDQRECGLHLGPDGRLVRSRPS